MEHDWGAGGAVKRHIFSMDVEWTALTAAGQAGQ